MFVIHNLESGFYDTNINACITIYFNRNLNSAVAPAPQTVQAAQLTVTAGPQDFQPLAPSGPQRSPKTGTGNAHKLDSH